MVLVLKQNYRLEDLLFDQAVELEKKGNTSEAKRKLNDALGADILQKRSLKKIRSYVVRSAVTEDLELFRDNFDALAEPYFNQHIETTEIQSWPHFGKRPLTPAQRKRNKYRHRVSRLLKAANRKELKEEEK